MSSYSRHGCIAIVFSKVVLQFTFPPAEYEWPDWSTCSQDNPSELSQIGARGGVLQFITTSHLMHTSPGEMRWPQAWWLFSAESNHWEGEPHLRAANCQHSDWVLQSWRGVWEAHYRVYYWYPTGAVICIFCWIQRLHILWSFGLALLWNVDSGPSPHFLLGYLCFLITL